MKFLLTSNGLSNESIAKTFFELVGKKPSETTIAFIPTAMNVEKGDKGWVIDDLRNIQKQDVKCIDIVDISALPKEVWLPRLEEAEVLFFSGGNTPHLMRWMNESGLADLLPKLLETKVYVGISAGSMVTNPTLALSSKDDRIYYEEQTGFNVKEGLNFVNLYIRPHYNSKHFPNAREDYIREVIKEQNISVPVYALDDMSALKIVDGTVEVVSEGEWLKI